MHFNILVVMRRTDLESEVMNKISKSSGFMKILSYMSHGKEENVTSIITNTGISNSTFYKANEILMEYDLIKMRLDPETSRNVQRMYRLTEKGLEISRSIKKCLKIILDIQDEEGEEPRNAEYERKEKLTKIEKLVRQILETVTR